MKTVALQHPVGCDSEQVQTVSPSEIYAYLSSVCREACRQLAAKVPHLGSCGLSLSTHSKCSPCSIGFLYFIVFPHFFPSCPTWYTPPRLSPELYWINSSTIAAVSNQRLPFLLFSQKEAMTGLCSRSLEVGVACLLLSLGEVALPQLW